MNKYVYTSEAGTRYTEQNIREAVMLWVMEQEEFKCLSPADFIRLNNIVYSSVMDLLEWQSPDAVIGEQDEDDIKLYLETLRVTGTGLSQKPNETPERPNRCPKCKTELQYGMHEWEFLSAPLAVDLDLDPEGLEWQIGCLMPKSDEHNSQVFLLCKGCATKYKLEPWLKDGTLIQQD